MRELHDIWNDGIAKDKQINLQSQDELRALLVDKTKSSVSKINRNMFVDAIAALTISLMMIGFVFYLELENKEIIIASVFSVMIILGIHYRIKYKILNRINVGVHSISDNIEKLITHLTWYKRLYLITIPTVTGILYSIVHYLMFNLLIGNWVNNPDFWMWEALVIPVVLITYFLVRWLYNRIYGSHLHSLKESLNELIGE